MKAVPHGDEPQARSALEALQPRYEWRLRELMALRRNWYTTTKLAPELRKYGFDLDRSNIYRLVKADRPPKMPVELILALCKILKCTFEDLVVEIQSDAAPVEPAARKPRPVVPDMPLLSGDFFDAEG
ncbi:helix-turn-helix domain-containing protein [Streptomyces sp. NRRL B-24484]|uniref:helix-turn-helix domain-containing protein n=1 Tax=Streptomyces sp. NRRL B-24484 TaxID=1463833 RepID=UPI000693E487|nr:helix-turn-helix transcriptional regulator [Streptomyces sp. NRRL B-24484]